MTLTIVPNWLNMVSMFNRRVALLSLSLSAGLLLAACGGRVGAERPVGQHGQLRLVASFYPLQWATQQVTGRHAVVGSLTKPGAEPHDLELTPQDVAKVADADLVVYLGGFQPAVDDAISSEGAGHGFDIARAAQLDLVYTPIEEGQAHAEEAGATDPHFWLDPTRLATVADAIAGRLSRLDPPHAADYRRNADRLTTRLDVLDRQYVTGLADCANPDLVTSHNAFGYLARRYGLTQEGITGLTPDAEPRPADLAAVATFVRTHRVHTIYYETLVSPRIAQTVASETGAATAVLDPIEGLTDRSQGRDYIAVMRANLANLRAGQPCH
jgi:zinc transport system substrate-binding protein